MKTYPILFSTPMVRAILQGRKTQTRRLLKPQPEYRKNFDGKGGVFGTWFNGSNLEHPKFFLKDVEPYYPYGQPGDLIWVRESHRVFYSSTTKTFTVQYSDGIFKDFYYKSLSLNLIKKLKKRKSLKKGSWVSARFLPNELARIWLRNKGYKIERLNDISEEDAIAEGVEQRGTCFRHYHLPDAATEHARHSFQTLWNSIHGPGSWQANPYVWALSFEVVSTSGPYMWVNKSK